MRTVAKWKLLKRNVMNACNSYWDRFYLEAILPVSVPAVGQLRQEWKALALLGLGERFKEGAQPGLMAEGSGCLT